MVTLVTEDAVCSIFPVAFDIANAESEDTVTFLLKSLLKNIKRNTLLVMMVHILSSIKGVFGNLEEGDIRCF